MSKQWIYEIVEIKSNWWGAPSPEKAREQLIKLGKQGWELVSVTGPGYGYASVAYLKKEI